MPILATLKKETSGEWPSLADYLREARHRETGALAALASALSAPIEEQKELAGGPDAGAILLELACDLRVPKGSRLAAARVLLEGGISGPLIGQLFIGAGDLVTDPRLGAAARRLVEGGLPAALQLGGEVSAVSLAAGSFARAVQASASAVGQTRAKELLASAPKDHAGAAAGLYALGQGELPPEQLESWKKLLESTCAANRRAPAAAKRLGMAPPWPPNLPDAFAAMVLEAEKKNQGVVAADAAKNPALLKKSPPLPTAPAPPRKAAQAPPPPPPPAAPGKTVAPPIKRSPFRKAIGAVVEVPTNVPAKPMSEVKGRSMRPPPAPARPHIEPKEDAPLLTKPAPLPISALRSKEVEQIKLDPRGRKVPRPDRWNDDEFEWDLPILPSSELPPPIRAAVAPGPFTQRLQSLFDDRPEAVDRLCAAAEARWAVKGEETVLKELSAELSNKKWKDVRAPSEQLSRLQAIERDEKQPAPWRIAARFLLQRLPAAGSR
ncbi:MAG: hypothetical protein LC689_03915 [Myxococcales bacterium]|nr:hypothetical protein [Myxococcales bacterium]